MICTFQGVAGLARHDTLTASGGVAGNGGTMEVQLRLTPGRRLTRPKQRAPRRGPPPNSTFCDLAARQSTETRSPNRKLEMTVTHGLSGSQALPATDQRVASPHGGEH